MKLIISIVEKAMVNIENKEKNEIWKWVLIYMWVSKQDCSLDETTLNEKLEKITRKICNLQLFVWENDKINTSLKDINGEILLISNFTLYGKNKKWNKIDFLDSWDFQTSKKIYDLLIEKLISENIVVKTWKFGAYMEVESKNLGPLNYVLEF